MPQLKPADKYRLQGAIAMALISLSLIPPSIIINNLAARAIYDYQRNQRIERWQQSQE